MDAHEYDTSEGQGGDAQGQRRSRRGAQGLTRPSAPSASSIPMVSPRESWPTLSSTWVAIISVYRCGLNAVWGGYEWP